jgi:ABC-type phosphate/phosphonate transport system substrate-binding protein
VSNIVKVGVVAYDPKVVTIWEGIKAYFTENGVATDYILFSNYDTQIDALLAGWIDIAWNTNLAYVKVHRRTGGRCGVLAMRDTDVGFTTTIVTGRNTGIEKLSDLRGKRFALGSRDSGQASILPMYFLKQEGVDPIKDLNLLRFDLDVGKHGDTGTSEVEVLKAVALGEADAGAVGDQYWARALSENLPESRRARAIWTSPGYCHCNFTVRMKEDEQKFARWTETLLSMDYNRPVDRKIMDMEGLKKWIRPVMDGYNVLFKAVDDLKFFND